jgi:radical SAM superfamily enzyme YgiQ (UPF0313 family)
MEHLPEETILSDVATNLSGGGRTVALVTEDVLRYGGSAAEVRPDRLIALLERIGELTGPRMIQTDHANVASVAAFSDEELRRVWRLLAGRDDERDYVWLNLGVETASGRLLAKCGGRPKMKPWPVDEWGRACMEQVRRLCRAGFFPLVSLVLGLPGETEEDVEETLRWVEELRGERVAVIPMFHAPVNGAEPFGLRQMTPLHWRLLRRGYAFNFKWIPRVVWNNQQRAGVPLARRAALQALGRLHVLWWKGLFAWHSRRLRP